jgi:hypothetical protein
MVTSAAAVVVFTSRCFALRILTAVKLVAVNHLVFNLVAIHACSTPALFLSRSVNVLVPNKLSSLEHGETCISVLGLSLSLARVLGRLVVTDCSFSHKADQQQAIYSHLDYMHMHQRYTSS